MLSQIQGLIKRRSAPLQFPGSVLEPFLHVDPHRVYNPLTGASLAPGDRHFPLVQQLHAGTRAIADVAAGDARALMDGKWMVQDTDASQGLRYRLKYAAIEANSACNQSCYFCPVSTGPRPDHTMSLELYETIVAQLATFKETLEGVSMIQYNEPTLDRLFLDRLLLLKRYGLHPAFNTNGTGLTPARVDRIVEAGGVRYLSVNLSTLDATRYAADRGHDHVEIVLRNLDYLATRRIAPQMEIMVLGRGDTAHKGDFKGIESRYAGSVFAVKYAEVMDRAGSSTTGIKPYTPVRRLCGCEQTGSRPLEWVHILPDATCVLCCQDYHNRYVVGDLKQQSLQDVLAGPEFARLRRWAYGIEEAPGDFICRHCVFAKGA